MHACIGLVRVGKPTAQVEVEEASNRTPSLPSSLSVRLVCLYSQLASLTVPSLPPPMDLQTGAHDPYHRTAHTGSSTKTAKSQTDPVRNNPKRKGKRGTARIHVHTDVHTHTHGSTHTGRKAGRQAGNHAKNSTYLRAYIHTHTPHPRATNPVGAGSRRDDGRHAQARDADDGWVRRGRGGEGNGWREWHPSPVLQRHIDVLIQRRRGNVHRRQLTNRDRNATAASPATCTSLPVRCH